MQLKLWILYRVYYKCVSYNQITTKLPFKCSQSSHNLRNNKSTCSWILVKTKQGFLGKINYFSFTPPTLGTYYWFLHRLTGVHPTRSSLKMSLSLFRPITLVPREPSRPRCAGSKRLRPTRSTTLSTSLATSSRSGSMVLLVAGKPIYR